MKTDWSAMSKDQKPKTEVPSAARLRVHCLSLTISRFGERQINAQTIKPA